MNENRKLTVPMKLLNANGELNEAGWANRLILDYDSRDVRASEMRIKEWDYYHIVSDEGNYALSFCAADNRYMGLIDASVMDFNTKEKFDYLEPLIFPMGKLGMPNTSEKGNITYKSKYCDFHLDRTESGRHLYCKCLRCYMHSDFEADVYLEQPPMDTMVIATPWKEDKKAFYYNQKIPCMRASGYARVRDKEYTFDNKKDFGILDWGRGVWTYDNTWYWGIGSGLVEGVPFGFNVGYGFGHIDVPEDGEYILTVGIRKGGTWEKYLVITVNNTDEYEITAPSTMALTPDGRLQVKIKLSKGFNILNLTNPVGSRMDSAFRQYRNMGRELKRATAEYAASNNVPEKPICYSICEWGFNRPWQWGQKAGNLWRTTIDIKAFWASVLSIYEINVRLYKHAGPGTWNDPDMLEVGNGSLTIDENISHFSLWCMMAAPLILGNDVRQFLKEDKTPDTDNKILKILTNEELIAVDQDTRGIQAKRIKTNGITDILAKPLCEKELALCFFNKSGSEKEMSISFEEIHNESYIDLPYAKFYMVRDLWNKSTMTASDKITANVPSHGVKVFRIKAVNN